MTKKKPTKAESAHMSRAVEVGCMACRELGYDDSPCEIHHLRSGVGMGQRSSNYRVIGLCPYHHRTNFDAIHQSKATFEKKFGTEESLWKKLNVLMGIEH